MILLYDDNSSEEIKLAKQAIRYILDGRTAVITPSIHLSILVNGSILSENELADNAILILSFQKKYCPHLSQL